MTRPHLVASTAVTVALSALIAAVPPTAQAANPLPIPLPTGTSDPSPAETPAAEPATATVSVPDGVLKRGCRIHKFTYTVDVPTDDWTLEASIYDRRGKGINSQALMGPNDPRTDTLKFKVCRWATVAGKFRIRAVLNWYDDPEVANRVDLPVTKFRLRRPGR